MQRGRIIIVNFLNHIQEKNVGRQRNARDGGGRNFLMWVHWFSLVHGLKAGNLSSAIYVAYKA